MDITTFLGLLVGFGGILGGAMIEGLDLTTVLQLTAAIIVFGGTIGATLVTTPLPEVMQAVKSISKLFFNPKTNPNVLIAKLVELSKTSRKEGLLKLETYLGDPVVKSNELFERGVRLVMDGTEIEKVRNILEIESHFMEEEEGSAAKVFEAAGGYAPTIGILGAVLGLIHVMGNLADPNKLAEGIATAFVATVYGVGSANLVFLPLSGKLKIKNKIVARHRELIIEGLVSIGMGENPNVLGDKLKGFLSQSEKAEKVANAGKK